jgi:hypothetical protein
MDALARAGRCNLLYCNKISQRLAPAYAEPPWLYIYTVWAIVPMP